MMPIPALHECNPALSHEGGSIAKGSTRMTSTRHHQLQSSPHHPASRGRALTWAILAALLGLSALLAGTTPGGAQPVRPNLLYDTT